MRLSHLLVLVTLSISALQAQAREKGGGASGSTGSLHAPANASQADDATQCVASALQARNAYEFMRKHCRLSHSLSHCIDRQAWDMTANERLEKCGDSEREDGDPSVGLSLTSGHSA